MWQCLAFTKFLVPLSIEETARRTRELGFDGVDLPVRPGAQITHETARAKLPAAIRIFEAEGLKVPTLVSGIVNAKDPHADELLATAADCGVTTIRTGNWPLGRGDDYSKVLDSARRDLESLEGLARKHGVRCNFQIHSGNLLNLNCASARMMLAGRDPHWVGLQLDPGHLAVSGEPIAIAVSLTRDYIMTVNVKSPCYYAARQPQSDRLSWKVEWPRLTEGLVDWKDTLAELKRVGYRGPLSLHGEYPVQSSPELTSQWIKEDLTYLRRLIQEVSA